MFAHRTSLNAYAATREPDAAQALIEEWYIRGEIRERQAVLQSLALLPSPERFLWFGQDACHSHAPSIFEAMAEAFIREHRAIGRPVPEDVWQLIPSTLHLGAT